MKQAFINLLKVKSIITLAIIGALVYLSVTEYIPSEAFIGIASSVITYYFTRKAEQELPGDRLCRLAGQLEGENNEEENNENE